MPNYIVKCLWDFENQLGRGFSETHWLNSSGSQPPNLGRVLTQMLNLLPTRMAIAGEDIVCVSVRASYPTPGGIASLGEIILPVAVGQATVPSANWTDSLALQWKDNSLVLHKITHLRGYWYFMVRDGLYSPAHDTTGTFPRLLQNYASALISEGFGWPTVQPTSFYGTVTNYVIGAGGLVTFSVAPVGTSGPAPTGTGPYSVRFSRLNRSNSPLNKTFPCTWNSTTNTFTTTYPVGAGPFLGTGRFKMPVLGFVPYSILWQTTSGERRMGKAQNLVPGRAKRRPDY